MAAGRIAHAQGAEGATFQLPELPYAADALAPHIDARTMRIHHGKHHAGYTNKLNAALAEAPRLKGQSIEAILSNLPKVDSPETRKALRDNGGGYYNHRLFWEVMAPADAAGRPSPSLSKALERHFGSEKHFRETFTEAALSRFGSGWAWLVARDGELFVCSTPNQDNPLMKGIVPDADLGTPILGVDVWEHAYYLEYQNRRNEYLDAWWNLVDWNRVSRNFANVE
ncbi:MAG: superoxide dismutase [Opitutales bacterium]